MLVTRKGRRAANSKFQLLHALPFGEFSCVSAARISLNPVCLSSRVFFTACSASGSSGPNRVFSNLSQSAESPGSQTLAQNTAPKPVHLDKKYSRRKPLELSPGPPEGDTNDECTTVPSGWECVIQNGTNTDGAFYWPTDPSGLTITWTAPATTDSVTFSPTTFTTTTPPYQYNYTETASSTASIGNNYTASVGYTISGPASYCQTNFCGTSSVPTYLQVSCSLSLGHCPQIDIRDQDLGALVSASPPPLTATVVGEQQNLKVEYESGTGQGSGYSVQSSPVPTWTVGGLLFASYALGSTGTPPNTAPSPMPYPSSNLANVTLPPFYWLSTGTNSLSVSAVLKGTAGSGTETSDVTANAKYQVKAPTGSVLNGTPGSVRVVVTKTQARLVTGGATKGMLWNFSATAPADGSGMLNATRVINACRTAVISGTTDYQSLNTNGHFYLDNTELYADNSTTIAAGVSATWTDSDSPSTSCPITSSSIAANDTFNTTFLYKPDGVGLGSGNGVWVPLGVGLTRFDGQGVKLQLSTQTARA
jgi:hypothetical protein